MKRIHIGLGFLLLCMVLLTACGQTPQLPDESVPQDTSVSSTTMESTTTTTEQTTTSSTATITAKPTTTTTTTTAKPTTTTSAESTTTSATSHTTLVDVNPTYAAEPEEDPPQEKRQFRYTFDGQDILFSYSHGVYEDWKLLWYYEGTANTGEKLTAKVSAKEGYVQSVYYEEKLSDNPDAFGLEARQKLLAKMPDIEEVQKRTNFIGTGYVPGTKDLPYVQASIGLTDEKINVVCYWTGAVYDGTLRMTHFRIEKDWIYSKNPIVVEEGTLDFLYPQWV